MEDRWFLACNRQKLGPFTLVELRVKVASDQIRPNDMLLLDGATTWVNASTVRELFVGVPVAVPWPVDTPDVNAEAPAQATSASVSTTASTRGSNSATKASWKPIVVVSVIVAATITLTLILMVSGSLFWLALRSPQAGIAIGPTATSEGKAKQPTALEATPIPAAPPEKSAVPLAIGSDVDVADLPSERPDNGQGTLGAPKPSNDIVHMPQPPPLSPPQPPVGKGPVNLPISEKEITERVLKAGGKIGKVTVSLAWQNYNDLDLHVLTASGEKIFYAHRRSKCGGQLDIDENVSPTTTTPVENIFWPEGSPPQGPIKIYVDHYRNHGRPGCQDPTPFVVRVQIDDDVQVFQGTVSHLGNRLVLVAEIAIPLFGK